MTAPGRIEHEGRVVSVTEQQIRVEIMNRSACTGCRAKTLCSLSGQEEKQIALPAQAGQAWCAGEKVVVSLQLSLGFKAVFLMYVLPLIALLSVLFMLLYFNVSELLAGLSALMVPLFCYFLVWLFRGRIEKKYIFVLTKPHPA